MQEPGGGIIWRLLLVVATVSVGAALLMPGGSVVAATRDGRTRNESAPTERTLMDLVIWVTPPGPAGHCVVLDPGQLSVSLQLVGDDPVRPVSFSFYGYRGIDPAATIDELLEDREPISMELPIAGGTYCYLIANEAPVAAGAPMATTTRLGQDVAIKLTLLAQIVADGPRDPPAMRVAAPED